MERRCENCDYWEHDKKSFEEKWGKCKKYAPRLLMVCEPSGDLSYEHDRVDMRTDDWCGEFKSKDTHEVGIPNIADGYDPGDFV